MRGELISRITEEFLSLYSAPNADELLREYRGRNFLLGKTVDITIGEQTRAAVVLDVAQNFGLRVRYANGREETLRSGEVHILPANGEGTW